MSVGRSATAQGSGGFLVFLREGVRASSDRYDGGGKSTTADRQIGYGARAFPRRDRSRRDSAVAAALSLVGIL